MTAAIAVSSPVTDAVLVALKTLGRPVGDHQRPAGPTQPPASFFPYYVVYVGTSRMQGTLVAPKEDGLHRVQVTTVGRVRGGVEVARDEARSLLLDPASLDIDGHAVVWTELAGGQPIARDDDVSPPLLYAVDVVNVFVTPIAGS